MATTTPNTLHHPYGHWIHISAASLCHHCRWPMQSMNAVSIFFSSIFVILVAQADRLVCPLVKTGPSEVQLIENGGRGVCALTLQLIGRLGNYIYIYIYTWILIYSIGGSRRIQSDDIPVIIMLTGNNKIGAYGMAAARHLINHGCHVVICASGKRQGLGDAIAQQEAMFEHVGGKIVYDIQGNVVVPAG